MIDKALIPGSGHLAEGRHRLPLRVYYEDTDFSGFVYHASYLRFFERGRSELLRSLGFHQRALYSESADSIAFVVRRLAIDFRRPAMMDDALIIETVLGDLRPASIEMNQRLWRASELLSECRVDIACLVAGRPHRLPENVRRAFVAFASTADAPHPAKA